LHIYNKIFSIRAFVEYMCNFNAAIEIRYLETGASTLPLTGVPGGEAAPLAIETRSDAAAKKLRPQSSGGDRSGASSD
jgi:hypothetical protein